LAPFRSFELHCQSGARHYEHGNANVNADLSGITILFVNPRRERRSEDVELAEKITGVSEPSRCIERYLTQF